MHTIWISESAAPNRGELVAAAVNGDEWAVGQLLGHILPIVTRICRGRIGHLPDSARAIDDVVQEVCIAVVSALPRYRADAPFIAFVVGIATNKIADAYRAAVRNKSRPMSDLPEAADPGAGPEQLVLQDERAIQLGRLLDRLPEHQRDIIVMRVGLGLSADEVAEALGSTPGAVRVGQHRALVALRRSVKE
ncbi:MAG: RNA polymerase sigma factor ShbA [Pseudonocardia sp.]